MTLSYGTVNRNSSVFYCGLACMDACIFWDSSQVSFSSQLVKREKKTAKTQQNNRLLFSAVIRRDSTRTATLRDPAGLFSSGPPSDHNRTTPTRSGFARDLKVISLLRSLFDILPLIYTAIFVFFLSVSSSPLSACPSLIPPIRARFTRSGVKIRRIRSTVIDLSVNALPLVTMAVLLFSFALSDWLQQMLCFIR